MKVSKTLVHLLLKPQTPKSISPSFPRHLSSISDDDSAFITDALRLLQPNDHQQWNLPHLQTLLTSSSPPSPLSLFHITRRLSSPSKALHFFRFVSQHLPDDTSSLSPAFQALVDLTFRNPAASDVTPFELYNLAKNCSVPLTPTAACLLLRSMAAAAMHDEAVFVFSELDPSLKDTHVRNVVIGVLLRNGRVDDALNMLDEMLHPVPESCVDDWTIDVVVGWFLRGDSRGRRLSAEEIAGLVSRFGGCGVFPSSVALTRLVTGLCKNRKINVAWDLLHDVMNKGGRLEAASCNALLSALGKWNDVKRMSELMTKMDQVEIKPTVITFGILIDRLCKSRRIDAAKEVFEKLSGGVEGVLAKPDVVIYNTLIDGLCKAGRQEEGLCLMERMKSQHGCAPNTVTYNTLIDGFNKSGDIEKGRELFDQMKEERIPMNVMTLNTMLSGLSRHGRLNTALEFFNEMEEKDLKGNSATYTILISSFCSVNNIPKAMEFFNRMLSSGCPTDANVYNCLISGLSQAGRMEDASFVVSKLKEAGFSMDIVSYNTMVRGFASKNKPGKIHELIEEMEASKVKPDSVTYNTLLAYLGKSRDFESANKVLEKMLDEGIATVVTFGTLIHAHCSAGDIENAMRIFRHMGSMSKIPPNTVIYNDIINSLCKKNDVKEALCLMEDMKVKGVRPNIQTFNALFKGLRENHLLEEAFKLMDQMVKEGCNPDYITLEILTKWLPSVGETERLKKFVKEFSIPEPQREIRGENMNTDYNLQPIF